MRVNRRAAVALLLLAVLLGGCWDRVEVEDQAFIIVLGIDRGRQEGQLLVTAGVALPQSMSTGVLGGASRPATPRMEMARLSAEAGTVTQALHVLNAGMTRRLELRHLRAVVVGDALSRAGLEPVVMEMIRSPMARGAVMLTLVKGTAAEAMANLQPVAELNPARVVEGLILMGKQLHLRPPVRMLHFIARLTAPGDDPFLPAGAVNPQVRAPSGAAPPAGLFRSALPGEVPRQGGNPLDFVGTAIFRRDRLVGYLTVDETQMLLAMRGEMGKAYMTFPDPARPDRPLTLRLHQENKPRYETGFRDGRPYARVGMIFEAETLAIPGGTDYSREDARQQLEHALNRQLERATRALVKKLREWGADPLGLGNRFRRYFPTWQDWVEYDWRSHVPELQTDVGVDVRIRRYGLTTGPDRVD